MFRLPSPTPALRDDNAVRPLLELKRLQIKCRWRPSTTRASARWRRAGARRSFWGPSETRRVCCGIGRRVTCAAAGPMRCAQRSPQHGAAQGVDLSMQRWTHDPQTEDLARQLGEQQRRAAQQQRAHLAEVHLIPRCTAAHGAPRRRSSTSSSTRPARTSWLGSCGRHTGPFCTADLPGRAGHHGAAGRHADAQLAAEPGRAGLCQHRRSAPHRALRSVPAEHALRCCRRSPRRDQHSRRCAGEIWRSDAGLTDVRCNQSRAGRYAKMRHSVLVRAGSGAAL